MKHSLMLPFATSRPEHITRYAALVEWTDVARLWSGQSMEIEPHQAFAHLAGSGVRIPVGIGVTLMPLRHPFEAAVQASSLARVLGHPVTIGYGPGAEAFQAGMFGAPYASQLTAIREYLTIVRALVRDQEVKVDGEYFSFHGKLGDGPGPRIEVGAGVLRPRMARLVGEVADVAITWLTPASYIRDVLRPALEDGASIAGKPPPRIVSMTPIAMRRRDRLPAETAAEGNAAHLSLPHYRDMLTRAGVKIRGHSVLDDAKALIDGDAFLWGDLDELGGKVAEFESAGVDEIVLNLTGVFKLAGTQRTVREAQALVASLTEASPGSQEIPLP